MHHNYFIAWPRMMKIGQIDVLFVITRSKMKRRVTYKDFFKDIMEHYTISPKTIFIGYPAILFHPSTHLNRHDSSLKRFTVESSSDLPK